MSYLIACLVVLVFVGMSRWDAEMRSFWLTTALLASGAVYAVHHYDGVLDVAYAESYAQRVELLKAYTADELQVARTVAAGHEGIKDARPLCKELLFAVVINKTHLEDGKGPFFDCGYDVGTTLYMQGLSDDIRREAKYAMIHVELRK